MSRWSLALTPAVLLLSREALALPAPLSDSELNAQAVVIADVTVTDAACESFVDTPEKATTTVKSTLQVDTAVKGMPGPTIQFSGFDIDWKGAQPSCSAITTPLQKGWRGRLYLSATNELVAWNGVKEDTATSKPAGYKPCDTGTGGAAGAGGSGTAGSGTAGSGAAGSATAGSGTAGSGTAGSGTAGSGTAGSGTSTPEEDTGCSVAATAPGGAGLALVAGALALAARRRRR